MNKQQQQQEQQAGVCDGGCKQDKNGNKHSITLVTSAVSSTESGL